MILGNLLYINTKKSKIIVFKNGGILRNIEKWKYKNNQMQIVNSYNYLGVIFNSNGSWNKAIDHNRQKANQSLFCLKSFIYSNISFLPANTWNHIFYIKILPILIYGSEIWGLSNNSINIEKTHIKFCKYLLQVGNNAPNVAVTSELGRLPLVINCLTTVIRFWLHIITLDHDRFVFKCYEFQLRKVSRNENCWAQQVKQLLFSTGFGYIWLQQFVYNKQLFLEEFKLRLCDIEKQKCIQRFSLYSKLRLFSLYKKDICLSYHITNIINVKHRRLLTKLRLGILELEIEKGRWENIERNKRTCKICNQNIVEDEYHFILQCTFYTDLRTKYIPKFIHVYPSINKLCLLLSNTKFTYNLGKYVYSAFERRNNYLKL